MRKLFILSIVLLMIMGISMSFTTNQSNNDMPGWIYLYIKWNNGAPAKHVKVQLGQCGKDILINGKLMNGMAAVGYTDEKGFVKLWSENFNHACYIYVNGKKYRKLIPMENGETYTFHISGHPRYRKSKKYRKNNSYNRFLNDRNLWQYGRRYKRRRRH